MKPFDPRLTRHVPAVRRPLAALAVTGVALAATVVAQAATLAAVLAAAASGRLDRAALAGFVAAIAARAGLLWAQGVISARAAASVKAALRGSLLRAATGRGPGWLAGQRAGSLATLVGRGLDALDPYFTGYLPQLILGVTIPVAVLGRLIFADWASAAIVLITLPLIPIFAILVGWQTRSATERQWRRLSLLGGHFLDMVAGLPTLRAFGRAQAQVSVVRRMADSHRVATMRTLRIAFLSALVLELVATLSVALVAVPVGLRVLGGSLPLEIALLVLLLAPEAYLPLRAAGAKFHASAEGLTALDQTFSLLSPPDGASTGPDGAATGPDGAASTAATDVGAAISADAPFAVIRFEGVTVAYERGAALRDASFELRAGERVALVGPSGAGKSTLLALLLGFVQPTSGRVTVDGVDLASLDIEEWRRRIAWVPQRPHLFAGTLAENIRLGAPDAPPAAVTAAVREAALTDVVAALPEGLSTRLGERGHGLSSGQRQRVALARAFLRDAPLLLLDEPTARLDGASEAAVLAGAERLAAGRTALIVAHRPALLAATDRVLHVRSGRIREAVRL
jgi:ATP-binding cassette subfamily C protein CydD